MLNQLPKIEADPLFAAMIEFSKDVRKNKVDLLIGIYRDETGKTPVFNVVQKAEQLLAEKAESKSYKMLSGNQQFNRHISRYLLGDSDHLKQTYTLQTVGGSGALRVLADFIAQLTPDATVWNTDPSYINHQPIMEAAGLTVKPFCWQEKNGQLDIETCFADLAGAKKGDVILLHGCCHNPTGIDPTPDQWVQFLNFCKTEGVVPLIDIAYQGFGVNSEEDANALRLFVSELDLVLIASSCSKNMGLYCERIGAASVMTKQPELLEDIRVLMENITRRLYSMPPNHGAAVATYLFENEAEWLEELATCRDRVVEVREALGKALIELGAPLSLQSLSRQKGMFSILPFTPDQMQLLQDKHAIYGTKNGRINIAGLQKANVRRVSEAFIDVLKEKI